MFQGFYSHKIICRRSTVCHLRTGTMPSTISLLAPTGCLLVTPPSLYVPSTSVSHPVPHTNRTYQTVQKTSIHFIPRRRHRVRYLCVCAYNGQNLGSLLEGPRPDHSTPPCTRWCPVFPVRVSVPLNIYQSPNHYGYS